MKNLEIYLVRHGQTEFNSQHYLQGWADSPLTQQGKNSAINLGNYLASQNIYFDAAFCSTSLRTQTTISLILHHLGQINLSYTPLADLREYHFGTFEGQPAEIMYQHIITERQLPDHKTWLQLYRHGTYNLLAETLSQIDAHAESETAFLTRIQRGINEVIQLSPSNGRILMVSHGMVIVALLKSIDPQSILYKSPDNTSISRLHFDGKHWRILSIGETAPLSQ